MFPFAQSPIWPPSYTLRIFTEHHDLGPIAVKKEHHVIDNIKAAILKHGNPFAVEGDKLHNVITHACIPDEYVQVILWPIW